MTFVKGRSTDCDSLTRSSETAGLRNPPHPLRPLLHTRLKVESTRQFALNRKPTASTWRCVFLAEPKAAPAERIEPDARVRYSTRGKSLPLHTFSSHVEEMRCHAPRCVTFCVTFEGRVHKILPDMWVKSSLCCLEICQ